MNSASNTLSHVEVSRVSDPDELYPTVVLGVERLVPFGNKSGGFIWWARPSNHRDHYTHVVSVAHFYNGRLAQFIKLQSVVFEDIM